MMMTVKVTASINLHAAVACDVLVGGQRSGTGDVGLDALRWLHAVDDVLHGLDRLVGQRFALVAGELDLDVGGLAVVALRAGAVSGSPQKSCTDCTWVLSASSCLIISS